MFFKNLKYYSNKKLNILLVLSFIIYFALVLAAPIAVVVSRYAIFEAKTVVRWTFAGSALLVIVVVVGNKFIRDYLAKFPTNDRGERIVRFTTELVFDLVIPVAILALLISMNIDFEKAFSTIRDCLIWFTSSIFFNNLVLKYLLAEKTLRGDTKHDIEKEDRKALFYPKEKEKKQKTVKKKD